MKRFLVFLVSTFLVLTTLIVPRVVSAVDPCSITTQVTADPDVLGGYIVGVTVHYPGLSDGGWYTFVLDIPGYGNNRYQNFQVSGNGFQMAFRLDSSHAGQTYKMYIRNIFDPLDFVVHDDAWCQTQVTIVAPTATPQPSGGGGGSSGGGGGTPLPPIAGGPFAAYLSAIETGIGLKYRDLGSGLSALLNYALTIGGILLLLYLLSGGYKLMFAAGDPKKMEEGRSIITNAIIGFIIIFTAYWLVKIVGMLLGLTQLTQTFQ